MLIFINNKLAIIFTTYTYSILYNIVYICNSVIQHILQFRYSLSHRELLEHARLHGEELAAMHQQNIIDFQFSNSKNQLQHVSISEGGKFYKLRQNVHSYDSHTHLPQSGHLLQAFLERRTNRP